METGWCFKCKRVWPVNLAASLASWWWCKGYLMSVNLCFLFWGIFVKINWNDICKTLVYFLMCIRGLNINLSSSPLLSALPPQIALTNCKTAWAALAQAPCQHCFVTLVSTGHCWLFILSSCSLLLFFTLPLSLIFFLPSQFYPSQTQLSLAAL